MNMKLNVKSLFLVWGFPQGAHRSLWMAQVLGMEIEHVYLTSRQGLFSAFLKYPVQTFKTFPVLFRHRPKVVFVQNPPIFGALLVYIWGLFTGTKLIIDSHTDALLASWWAWTLPIHRFLSRRAIATIVTNDHLRQMVADWGAPAIVMVNPPTIYPQLAPVSLDAPFNVMMVSSASYDEPVDQLLEAARALPEVQFHVTGNFERAPHHQGIHERAPSNVRFTGYLPDEQFFGLMKAAQVVMTMTTENHTLQSGASDAFWLGRPVITSDWPMLRAFFTQGAVLIDNTAPSIQQAIETIRADLPKFEAEVLALQAERRQEWWQKANELLKMIEIA